MEWLFMKDQLVEHGDSLRMRKQAQEGLLVKFERERKLTNTLLITGSGVRVPHNPLTSVSETDLLLWKVERLGEYESVGPSLREGKRKC